MHHKFVIFPFTAIVGQDLMKKALLACAVDPSIGGVLIKGDKGTGKSTAVRALADVLPPIKVVRDCPFNCDPDNLRAMCKACQERYEKGESLQWTYRKMEVVDMPLSATEDMVVGTLDIKRALKEGIRALQPGILARANRNILYIDEVNLLDDHLVNILLDCAAMGVNIIEREGISLYHPARFILIGTMNPEEGDLRPQILDRFGLCVEVHALSTKEERLKVMEYRRLFDRDPWVFEERFKKELEELRNRIVKARELLNEVRISQEILEKIVEITTTLGIKTHRADIVMEKTARALAALSGRDYVTEDDVREAALLALNHRLRQKPFEKNSVSLKEVVDSLLKKQDQEEFFPIEQNVELKKKLIDISDLTSPSGRDFTKGENSTGLFVRARPSEDPKSVAFYATLKKAVVETGKPEILPEHLMEKVRISRGKALYIILLDSSSSMKLNKKITFAKSLIFSLLKDSYEKRNLVSLMTFRNEGVEFSCPPTKDVETLIEILDNLPTGGKTPLTPGLQSAFEMAKKYEEFAPVIILISDGKGNLFINGSMEEDIKFLAENYGGMRLVIVNTESRFKSLGVLERLSEVFNAPCYYLDEVII